jgi:catechol 2,3-dioxygenase-like lactoylglutathione lyase family enzyme
VSELTVTRVVPILRIFDVAKAREFYLDFLGFRLDWEHRFGDDLPLYMQISNGALLLHLSEHYGDACPGAAVRIEIAGLREFHAALVARRYRYARPGIETTPWNSITVSLKDPFGNKLVFEEPIRQTVHPTHTGV